MYHLRLYCTPSKPSHIFPYPLLVIMKYFLRPLFFILLLCEIGAFAQHCHRTLGANIEMEDCKIAVYKLFNPYTRRLSEVQKAQKVAFVRDSPAQPHPSPEREGHGSCYISIAMTRGQSSTVSTSWNWLRQRMEDLLKRCVERHLGGSYTINGFGFMVAQMYY